MDKVRFFKVSWIIQVKAHLQKIEVGKKAHTWVSVLHISTSINVHLCLSHDQFCNWLSSQTMLGHVHATVTWELIFLTHTAWCCDETQWKKLNEVSAIFTSRFLPWNLNPVWICLVIQNCIKVGKWMLLYLRFKDHQSLESCVCQISWTIKKKSQTLLLFQYDSIYCTVIPFPARQSIRRLWLLVAPTSRSDVGKGSANTKKCQAEMENSLWILSSTWIF